MKIWLFFYSIAATMDFVMWGIYFAFTRRYVGVELGGGLQAVLLLTGLEWLYVLFAAAAGKLVRLVGERKLILLGSLGFLPLAVSAFVRDPYIFSLVLSPSSLAWSLSWPAVMSSVFLSAQGRLGRTYSLFTIGTGFGWSIGSFLMGFVHLAGGPRAVLLSCSMLYLIAHLLYYIFFPSTNDVVLGHYRNELEVPQLGRLKHVLIAYSLLVFCREAYFSVVPVKLSAEISRLFPEGSVEFYYIAYGIVYGGLTSFLSVPVRLLAGFLVDRCDPRTILKFSLASYVMLYWLFTLTEGLVPILVWQVPLYPIVDTAINVAIAKNSTERFRTHAFGAGLAFSALGGLGVLPLSAYPGIDLFSVGVLITAAGAAGLVVLGYKGSEA